MSHTVNRSECGTSKAGLVVASALGALAAMLIASALILAIRAVEIAAHYADHSNPIMTAIVLITYATVGALAAQIVRP